MTTSRPSRRVLMITYHFPPEAASGAVRVSKFAKYLPEFGWDPYILTVKEKYYGAMSRGQILDMPSPEKVFRTVIWPHPGSVYLRLKGWMRSLLRRKQHVENTDAFSDQRQAGGVPQNALRILRSLLWV